MRLVFCTDSPSEYPRVQRILGLTDVAWEKIPRIPPEGIHALEPGSLLVFVGALIPGGLIDLRWGGHRIWQLPKRSRLAAEPMPIVVRRRFYAELMDSDWFMASHVIRDAECQLDLGMALMPSDPQTGTALVEIAEGMQRTGMGEEPLCRTLADLPSHMDALCKRWGISGRHVRRKAAEVPWQNPAYSDRSLIQMVHERNGRLVDPLVAPPKSRIHKPSVSMCGGLPAWLRAPEEHEFH